jgi:hypothetical protein
LRRAAVAASELLDELLDGESLPSGVVPSPPSALAPDSFALFLVVVVGVSPVGFTVPPLT